MTWPPSRETLYAVAGICIICGTGLLRLRKERQSLQNRRKFAVEFQSRFRIYASDLTQENQTYAWLIANSPQMQAEMGGFGIYPHYRDGQYAYTNYPVILNVLPAIRRRAADINKYGGLFLWMT